jgi:Mn2+/Fe2+ NRAMP family transporter
MLESPWAWLTPLVGAGVVFTFVMWTTPPGFQAIADVVFGPPRGTNADSAAYVLGSAGSLALVTLLVLSGVSIGIEFALRRRHGRKLV